MTKEEIKFFNHLAQHWDEEEILSTPERIRKILGKLPLKKGMSVLDLGTGTGVLVPYLHEIVGSDGSITAVDISEGMLAKAVQKFGTFSNVRFLLSDFEEEPVVGRFDLIMLYCVYPHLHTPMQTVSRLLRDNLNPGGSIVVAFPTDETFINNIHRERKAESDLLPTAHELALRMCHYGLDAEVVSATPDEYIVSILSRWQGATP